MPIQPVEQVPENTGSSSAAPANRAGRGTRDVPAKPPAADSKPETKPDQPGPEPKTEPVPQLRPTDSGGAAKAARDTLDSARRILSTVDYRPLSRERKKAYDDARRFADEADAALKQGNVVYAQAVATKAETLAKQLAGR